MQHLFRQFLYILAGSGNLSPEEHSYLLFVVGASQCFHNLTGEVTTVAIVFVIAFIPVCFCFKSSCCSQLHGTKHTAVDITFHFQYPLYEFCVRCQHTDTPAGHIVTLAHRVELDATVFGSRHT